MKIFCYHFVLWMSLIFVPINVFAQSASLQDYQAKDLQLRKGFMWTLGGWSIANIGGGLILRSQETGSIRYFHEMNAIWNTVNLGIALPALISAYKEEGDELDSWKALRRQTSIERILMLNIGLNTGYIATGAFMIERSNRLDTRIAPERLKGYGQSLILQGGFLLLFDVIQYISYRQNGKKAETILWGSLDVRGGGLCYTYKF